MKRVMIYVQNEDMEALKPYAKRLEKKGAIVQFSALKYMEIYAKADTILTLPKYITTVKGLFKDLTIPVLPIVEDEDVPAPEPVKVAVQDDVLPPPMPTDEVVIMTVGPSVDIPPVVIKEAAPEPEVDLSLALKSTTPPPTPLRRK